MEVLISIIIWSLIVYRVATDVAEQDGPFEVFALIRGWAAHDRLPDWFYNGIHCPICISWWLGAIVALYHTDVQYFATAGIVTLIVKLQQG